MQCSSWKDAQKLETLTNYTLERSNDKFKITINDLFWLPTDHDSLNIKEIKGTVFETVTIGLRMNTNRQNKTTTNSTFAIGEVSCSEDSFVKTDFFCSASTFVLQIANFAKPETVTTKAENKITTNL